MNLFDALKNFLSPGPKLRVLIHLDRDIFPYGPITGNLELSADTEINVETLDLKLIIFENDYFWLHDIFEKNDLPHTQLLKVNMLVLPDIPVTIPFEVGQLELLRKEIIGGYFKNLFTGSEDNPEINKVEIQEEFVNPKITLEVSYQGVMLTSAPVRIEDTEVNEYIQSL